MSPILVRPVREQLEHDRVIRLLQAKYKRKYDVAINPGNEQTAPVGSPQSPWYPDLVLFSNERTKKLAGVVEVETAESVNHLEAMRRQSIRVPERDRPRGSRDPGRGDGDTSPAASVERSPDAADPFRGFEWFRTG